MNYINCVSNFVDLLLFFIHFHLKLFTYGLFSTFLDLKKAVLFMFLPFPRIESPRAKKFLTTFKIKIISCTKIKINDHCGGGGTWGCQKI